jgi:hypothetical protein
MNDRRKIQDLFFLNWSFTIKKIVLLDFDETAEARLQIFIIRFPGISILHNKVSILLNRVSTEVTF